MTEVEIKARVKDHSICQDKIEQLGGRFMRQDHQVDIIFGRPQDLDENSLLLDGTFVGRIRQENDQIRLEFKEARRAGGAREISALINKISDGEYLLEVLGYEKAFTIEKKRKRFSLDGFDIGLDTVTDLGTFIEIEHASKDGGSIAKDLAECKELLNQIDANAAIERRKYGDLMQEIINNRKK